MSKISDISPGAATAGIWWQGMPSGLLWAAEGTDDGETGKLKNPSSYLAPSWSWAPLSGATYHPLAVIENTANWGPIKIVKFNDVHLEGATPKNGGFVGCSTGFFLSLSAPLLRINPAQGRKTISMLSMK